MPGEATVQPLACVKAKLQRVPPGAAMVQPMTEDASNACHPLGAATMRPRADEVNEPAGKSSPSGYGRSQPTIDTGGN